MPSRSPRRWRVLAASLLLVLGGAPEAVAAVAPERTVRASEPAAGGDGDGQSTRPSLTPAGTFVAFESEASNLVSDSNGPVRDIFLREVATGRTTLVSTAAGGGPADGPSLTPVAGGSASVAFASDATNLVEGDTNDARDVFIRRGGAPIRRVSVAADGSQANGPSSRPDASRDGRFVVFTSSADNLVTGDANGVEDVFVRDLVKNETHLVSQRNGAAPSGRSRGAAISPDGRWVSFESTAADLVPGDRNRVPDVFVADLQSPLREVKRVSVSSREVEQNRAVVPPFVTVSDVSADGRFVVFDSDATNLVRGDDNRDTDVFVRNVLRGTTERISTSLLGREGDNDSYFPSITGDGRYVAFTSFAGNLFPGDVAGEDVFVHDRKVRTTSLVTVTSDGRRRPPEAVRQLLRRPTLSDSARTVAFTSTAALVAGKRGQREDVFVRSMERPEGRIRTGPKGDITQRRPRLRLAADEGGADVFLCRLDRTRRLCPRSGRLPALRRGRHRLAVFAGGAGMLFDDRPVLRSFRRVR